MSYYTLEKTLTSEIGRKLLFTNDGKDYLVASYSSSALDPEVLLFKADKSGKIISWTECFGEKHDRKTEPLEAIYSTMTTYNKVLRDNDLNGAWE